MAEQTDTATDTTPAASTDTTASTTGSDPNTVLGGATAPAGEKPADATTTTTDKPGDQGADGGDGKEAKAGDGKADKPDDKPAGAPEKYELELPEGFSLDPQVMTEFEPVLRELGFDNANASKLAGAYARIEQAKAAAYGEMVQEWGKQAASDPEIGGKAFPENVELARSALIAAGRPSLKEKLDRTGLGNDADFIAAFAYFGRMIPKEDGVVKADRSGGSRASAASVLYNNTPSKS